MRRGKITWNITENKYIWIDNMGNVDFEILKYSSDTSLRPYQKENKEKVYNAWKTKRSVLLQMPTGTGKTRLFSSIIKDIENYSTKHEQDLSCLVVVHRMELINQIVQTLSEFYGLESGIIQAGFRQKTELRLQVASVQTLSRRLEKWTDKQFDFIIVDEAHHVPAESYLKIINSFPEAKLLGVTATPYRLSGEGFTDIFDKLITSPSVKEFIDMGVLSKYDYYSVRPNSEIQRELDQIKILQSGDYTDADMTRVCDNDHIRAQVVETYLKYAAGKKGIIYTINKVHNYNLCQDFRNHGIKTVAIDSSTPTEIRTRYIEDFKEGKIDIICNVNIFSEGFDCPDIEFVQLARPTQSLSMFLQQVGRGLRISEGKEKCLFLDNVGLYNRFGFPSSKRKWHYHFIGHEEAPQGNGMPGSSMVRRQEKDLSEGDEEVFLIETVSELKFEKKRAQEVFQVINSLNTVLINRDDYALRMLEEEFSKSGESSLCFDGHKVSVWKDNSSQSNTWGAEFYIKNFRFRFEHEPETRCLASEDELNKWLTFRFLTIRENVDTKKICDYRKEISKYSFDKEYLIDMYNRWFDNDSENPLQRNLILEQLVGQTYDYLFENDSGNRVFAMIMQMPSDKRKVAIGR